MMDYLLEMKAYSFGAASVSTTGDAVGLSLCLEDFGPGLVVALTEAAATGAT